MPDPVNTEGAVIVALHQACVALHNRIKVFTTPLIASLDRISPQKAREDIGRTDPGARA